MQDTGRSEALLTVVQYPAVKTFYWNLLNFTKILGTQAV